MIRSMRTGRKSSIGLALLSAAALFLGACEPVKVTQQRRSAYHMKVGQLYLEQGQVERALAQFEIALQMNPNLVEAHVEVGNAFNHTGDYRRAHTSYERAVKLAPTHLEAQRGLGLMKQLLGLVKEAVKVYLRALAIKLNDFQLNDHIASAYIQLGRAAEALPYAKRATALNDLSLGAWANLAFSYTNSGEYDKAVDAYRRAIELTDGGEPPVPIVVGLADAHIRLKHYERAEVVLKNLIRRHPTALGHERLGYCRFKQRRFQDALASYAGGAEARGRRHRVSQRTGGVPPHPIHSVGPKAVDQAR